MLNEYDVVKAKRKLSNKVLKNLIGRVMMIFPEFPNDLWWSLWKMRKLSMF